MRRARLVSAAVLIWFVAVGLAVVPRAQAPTSDEDFDKLMKSVGATVGAIRKSMEGQPDAAAAEAKKLGDLMKQNAAFWTARQNTEAAAWATEAATHAAEVDKALVAKNTASAAEHTKLLMAGCQQCHTKYRDKAADGTYVIKK